MTSTQQLHSVEHKPFSALGQQLRGVHHIGLTVEDMGKALEFYTEVLGGKIIIPEIGLDGETMHNTLLQKEEIDAINQGIEPKSIGIPNLRDGEEKLDLYFIQFDNIVLEILQYRDSTVSPNSSVAFPA